MQLIKAFLTMEQYIDNTVATVAPFGELSVWSQTYRREKSIYVDSLHPTFRLTTFTSKDSNSNLEEPVTALQTLQIMNIVKHVETYAGSHIRPYNTSEILSSLLANFLGDARDFKLGAFVDNGSIAMPEWISWVNSSENDNETRVWLSDVAFSSQYDEYEIYIIPPFTDVDHFYNNYGSVEIEINGLQTVDLISRMEIAKAQYPETYWRVLNFNFHNSSNVTESVGSEWGLLIYGKAGDNIDNIKDKLEQYILDLSTHVRSEWVTIFPEIFKRTEFVVVPRWDKVSIPNLSINSVLYSSISDPVESIDFAKTNVNMYPDVWVESNVSILPFDYKALTLLIVDGADNIVGKQHLEELFSDYIPVSTSTLDFSRMTEYTRDWLLLLELALIAAETADNFASIPEPLRKVEKLSNLYIAFLYDNVNYLVSAKFNDMYQP